MFGFHWAELLVVLALAVVIFGPKRIPEIGGSLGRGIRDFRKGVADLQEDTGYNEIKNLPRDMQAAVTEPVRPTAARPQDSRSATATPAESQGPAAPVSS
jgi:sec-independent protein translocase protein TatA